MNTKEKGKKKDAITETVLLCPNEECGHETLLHFGGIEGTPAHHYCPQCLDFAYDDKGKYLGDLYAFNADLED